MQSLKKNISPIRYHLILSLAFLVLLVVGKIRTGLPVLLPAVLGIGLGVVILLVTHLRRIGNRIVPRFPLERLADYMVYVILLVGILWSNSQDLFFIALAAGFSFSVGFGLLIIKLTQ